MLLDTHLHTKEYSPDSFLPVREAINRARSMGLSGLCVTDHDSIGIKSEIEALRHECSFPIFAGIEVLTKSGDFIVFGLDYAPLLPSAEELINIVHECGGVAVAAHPYRDNGRGAGELINTLAGLDGVECFNGSTKPEANSRAFREAKSRGLACLGASDAHLVERVGKFATLFHGQADNEQDLIKLIKAGACEPVAWDGKTFKEVTLS